MMGLLRKGFGLILEDAEKVAIGDVGAAEEPALEEVKPKEVDIDRWRGIEIESGASSRGKRRNKKGREKWEWGREREREVRCPRSSIFPRLDHPFLWDLESVAACFAIPSVHILLC